MTAASDLDPSLFMQTWRSLDRRDRARLRRLIRLGRPVGPEDEALARDYARFQKTRIWNRWFWVWFVPGLLVALGVAASIHPLVVGVVLALSAQAVFTHRNLARRAARPI